MTAISTIRPVPEQHGLRNGLVAFFVAAALGLGVAAGYVLDDDSSASSTSQSESQTTPLTAVSADSIDRPQPPSQVIGSADSLERQAQAASTVSTDNSCRLPDSRMPC